MNTLKTVVYAIFLLLFFTLTACQTTRSALPETTQPQAETEEPMDSVISSDQPRNQAVAVPTADLTALAAGQGQFALALYQALRTEPGNLFFSPYSISTALAMAYAGASGETEHQMAETLHYQLPQAPLHSAFNALDLALISDQTEFVLNNANSLWGQTGYMFQPDFLDTLAENYGAGLKVLDFMQQTEEARLTINQWVSDNTAGKIQDLIAKGVLTSDTRLVLTNAIYFKGEWEMPFNQTQDGTFSLLTGEAITTPLMSRRSNFRFAQGESYQAIALPYKGGAVEMIALLPEAGQFQAFESTLTLEQLGLIVQQMQSNDIRLTMPKFTFESSFGLAPTLADLGMLDAFDPTRADFSRMTGNNDLFISDVFHKAFVAVDEMGTEAAAATGMVMEVTSMPLTVTLDRPFIFLILDTQSNIPLFVGRVLDPRP